MSSSERGLEDYGVVGDEASQLRQLPVVVGREEIDQQERLAVRGGVVGGK